MLKTFAALTAILISIGGVASEPVDPKMAVEGGNISITFNDYSHAEGFENYRCLVDFGTWTHKTKATRKGGRYQCFYQGSLQVEKTYPVRFEFENRPYRVRTQTEVFSLGVFSPTVGSKTIEYSMDDYTGLPADGFVFSNVDLRAIVAYPVSSRGTITGGKLPLFLFQHGQHAYCDGEGSVDECESRVENHKGHQNLIEEVAKLGVIAVSIDAYDVLQSKHKDDPMPIGNGYNDQRALLFEEHIKYLTSDGFEFEDSIDADRISFGGHSRGGGAAYQAAKESNRNILSVSLLAPAGLWAGYTGIGIDTYTVIGSADNDVVGFWGYQAYSNSGVESNRTLAYIRGANHNWFNSKWVEDDSTPLRNDFMTREQQESLSTKMIKNFMREVIGGEKDETEEAGVDYSRYVRGPIILSDGIDRVASRVIGKEGIRGSFWGRQQSYNRVKTLEVEGYGSVWYDLTGLDTANRSNISLRMAHTGNLEDFKVTLRIEENGQEHVIEKRLPTGYDLVESWALPREYFMSTVNIDLKENGIESGGLESVTIAIPYSTTVYIDDVIIH